MHESSDTDLAKEVIGIENFREMQGILGSFYISEAVFRVMMRLRKQLNTNQSNVASLGAKAEFYLTIEDYLVYNDVAFYG